VRRIAATAGVLAFFIVAGSAKACDCASLSLSRRFAEADLVLVARVSSYRQLEYVTVAPTEIFKGSAAKALTIRTGTSDCDFFLPPVSPKVGDEYLLFLLQAKGQFTASRCLVSGRKGEKAMDLRVLRKTSGPR
jgi:hypothetical protein